MTEKQRRFIIHLIESKTKDIFSELSSHDTWDWQWDYIETGLGLSEEEGYAGVALEMICEVLDDLDVRVVENTND